MKCLGRLLPFLVLLFLIGAGCGNDGASPGGPVDEASDTGESGDSGPTDGDQGGSDEGDDVADTGDVADDGDTADGPDTSDGPSTPPETVDGVILCDPQADDCPDGPCVTFDASFDQGLCGTFCVTDADCPSTFRCVRITVGADVETACLPIDFCLDQDGDGYGFGPGCAGPDCDDNDPDVYFGAPSLCDGKDNNCNGLIDDNPVGTGEDCDTGFPGICAEGRQQCSFGTWECSARRQPAEFETCNGLDTTCDGLVDATLDDAGNVVPLTRRCYEGPSGTEGVGQCRAGIRTCVDGEYASCEDQVLPATVETCNGLDDTCNGLVDDNPLGMGTECDTGQPGRCSEGRTICAGGEVVCSPLFAPALVETCNGLDDTCDGLIDAVADEDGNPVPLTRSCYDGPGGTEGVGICRAGIQTCEEGEFGLCEGQVLPAAAELCDGQDTTCNGRVDDNPIDVGQTCETGLPGICAEGLTQCIGGVRECVPLSQPAPQETCNGRDMTCDGLVDQVLDENGDPQPLRRSCYTGPPGTQGLGQCRSGWQTCEDGEFGACEDQILPAPVETCDGLDNTCSGQVDDDPIDVGQSCETGQPGICGPGVYQCQGGVRNCVALRAPVPVEQCSGQDDTCDGLVDMILNEDGDPEPLSRSCYGGPPGTAGVGACRAGVQVCEAGEYSGCVGEVRPAAVEVCDGQDNTCNGLVDDNPVDVGGPCNTGLPGTCGEGRWECIAGERVCTAINTPSPFETCNGRDDTCDGLVDQVLDENGNAVPLTESCYSGPAGTQGVGICTAGIRTCSGGSWSSCAGEVLPREETCNGLDDNCDGLIDNANSAGARLSQPCYEGPEDTEGVGECRGGTRFCVDGEYGECVGQVLPAPVEVCDGRDNTCDGLVDQTAPGVPLSRSCYDGPSATLGVGVCVGGTQTCTGGEFGSCVGQVLPGVELCNGLDNNCDGTADSGNPGGGIPCNSGLPGVCAAGVTACLGGDLECVANIQPGELTERCNGLDENCDGTVDSGFIGLGQPCFVGEGICRRSGLNICNPSDDMAQPICDATPGAPETEVCNYQDNSCDGNIDTGFRNAQGIYDTVEHCGACDLNCNNLWPGGPAQYNVVPRCQVAGGVAQCGFDCLPGFVDADGVAENGCELEPDLGAVYVARPVNGGTDTGSCGTWNSPCATINHALGRTTASRPRVRVGDGVFRERVTVPNGRSLLGGHNSVNWQRNPSVFVSLISGAGGDGPDRVAVRIENVTSTTELSGFTIQSENALTGGNSIGIYIRNASSALRVSNNQVFAGAGAQGLSGTDGTNGLSGQAGSAGQNSYRTTVSGSRCNNPNAEFCTATPGRPGGPGGQRTCSNPGGSGNTVVNGGRGGWTTNPIRSQREGNGQPGQGPSPGDRGLGAGDNQRSGSGCLVSQLQPNLDIAQPGTVGGNGSDGTGGGGGSAPTGTLSGGQWRALNGQSGVHGGHGSGGGGGGAGPGVQDGSQADFGASGGGGGSGGCAGSGGTGGTGGGGSFGIFLLQDSPSANASAMPVIEGNTIQRGNGGNGGSGGTGGGGGEPGDGGAPGVYGTGLIQICLLPGAPGSRGGRGGHAGGGGGGAGGNSYDVFARNAHSGTLQGYGSSNTFPLPEGEDTAGRGGGGGNSSNTAVGVGVSGIQGAFGRIGTF